MAHGGASYLGSFAAALMAGFDPLQQPLRTILKRQRRQALESAGKSLRVHGCWSCRGVPESKGSDGGRRLNGREIFLMVPEAGGGWRALTGPVLVGQAVDLDPSSFRWALAMDSEDLRSKCSKGDVNFSVDGQALQASLGWDFDSDYFVVIENPEIIPANILDNPASHAASARPSEAPTHGRSISPASMPSLAEVQARFLLEFPTVDVMGLLHYQWQMLAGKEAGAAAIKDVQEVAGLYDTAVDVEKGGRRASKPKFIQEEKWDFMKGSAAAGAPESPTAAGLVHRMAKEALQKLEEKDAVLEAQELVPDSNLWDAWQTTADKLGTDMSRRLIEVARRFRSELLERVKREAERQERDNSEDNPSMQACLLVSTG